jgi:hypothetical protein
LGFVAALRILDLELLVAGIGFGSLGIRVLRPALMNYFRGGSRLNAPTPIALHYGALDTPSPDNRSAAYNDSVPGSIARLREIYAAGGAVDNVHLLVSESLHHELDVPAILSWLDAIARPGS